MISTDSLFRIGDSHKVCQDYALHGKDYIIVSDGCSSSPDTDFGSRLISVGAKAFLQSEFWRQQHTYNTFGYSAIKYAEDAMNRLILHSSCLDATLLCAFYFEGNVFIRAYGDGNIIIEYVCGKKDVININFESGAPYYLSYLLDEERKARYPLAFPGVLTVNGETKRYCSAVEYVIPAKAIKSVTLVTDGYDSFIKEKASPYVLDVNEVIGFKNIKGEFLQRRVDKYLTQLKKQNIVHYDDFGIACMLFDHAGVADGE